MQRNGNPHSYIDPLGLAPDWYVDDVGGFLDFVLNHNDEIAREFGLNNPGSISRPLHDVRLAVKHGEIVQQMKRIDCLIIDKRT